ncbi:MAG: hypothetical protein SOH81_11405, partial [Acetobacter sp.]
SIFFSFILYGRYLSMISMVCAFLFLVSSYVRAIIDSIKTPYIYKAGKKLIKIWTGKVENVATYIGENDEKDQVIIINGNKFSQKTLGAALITSGAYYFTSNVIDSYKNRNMIFVYNVALFLYLWLCIVFSISIMNYTLWIIDPIEFSVSENIGFFDFIFYSFREMAFADVDNIKAIMICSKSLQMIDNFTFIFLGAIMAIAIFTNKNEKFIRENEEVSNVLKSGYREINNNICAACNISDIENIKSELEVVNNGLYKILKFLLREV